MSTLWGPFYEVDYGDEWENVIYPRKIGGKKAQDYGDEWENEIHPRKNGDKMAKNYGDEKRKTIFYP